MNLGPLSILTAPIGRILDFCREKRQGKEDRRKELNRLQADLNEIRREYLRFIRGGGTDPYEHSRIIRKAQKICDCAAPYEEPCPQECLDVCTDNDADLKEFRRLNAQCQHNLRYISKKRLTDNQVTREDNRVECEVWGEYQDRNHSALEDAIERLEVIKSK